MIPNLFCPDHTENTKLHQQRTKIQHCMLYMKRQYRNRGNVQQHNRHHILRFGNRHHLKSILSSFPRDTQNKTKIRRGSIRNRRKMQYNWTSLMSQNRFFPHRTGNKKLHHCLTRNPNHMLYKMRKSRSHGSVQRRMDPHNPQYRNLQQTWSSYQENNRDRRKTPTKSTFRESTSYYNLLDQIDCCRIQAGKESTVATQQKRKYQPRIHLNID